MNFVIAMLIISIVINVAQTWERVVDFRQTCDRIEMWRRELDTAAKERDAFRGKLERIYQVFAVTTP